MRVSRGSSQPRLAGLRRFSTRGCDADRHAGQHGARDDTIPAMTAAARARTSVFGRDTDLTRRDPLSRQRAALDFGVGELTLDEIVSFNTRAKRALAAPEGRLCAAAAGSRSRVAPRTSSWVSAREYPRLQPPRPAQAPSR
jgi:hypothetical protein